MATQKRYPDADGIRNARIQPNNYPSPGPIGNTTGLIVPDTEPNPHGNSAPPIEPTEAEKGWWESWGSPVVHAGLDAAGLIPLFGEVADGANAVIYLAEGDYVNAGISTAAMVPALGMTATGGKYGAKVAGAATEALTKKTAREAEEAAAQQAAKKAEEEAAARAAKEAEEAAAKKSTDNGNSPGGKVQGSRNAKGKCGEWLAKMDMFDQGYTDIMEVQNKSGHGIDVMARNANGDIRVLEVKTTDGATAPGLSSAQSEMGGEKFTENRVGRAAEGEGHYKNSPQARENGIKAQEWLREAKGKGAKVQYEKYDVFIEDIEKGCVKKKSVSNPWDSGKRR